MFCALLAITSAHTRLSANTALATKAYNQIKTMGVVRRDGFVRGHYKGLVKYLATGKVSGQKCSAFYKALCGDPDAVVIDVWMTRWYFGQHDVRPLSPRVYNIIVGKVRDRAWFMGVTPVELQAQVWCEVRGNTRSYADYLRQGRLL